MSDSTSLLIYDGTCPICSRVAQRIRCCSRDTIRIAPLASLEAQHALKVCYPQGYEKAFYFIDALADVPRCLKGFAAIKRIFGSLGYVGSVKLLLSASFWQAARKMLSHQPATCCGQNGVTISRRRLLRKLGIGAMALFGLSAAASSANGDRSDGGKSEPILDPEQRSTVLDRIGQSGDFAGAVAKLREKSFGPRYALEEAIPFQEKDTVTQKRWIQVVLPFWREGVSADQLTGDDVAVAVAVIEEGRLAVLAFDFPEEGQRFLYAGADGEEAGTAGLVWAPLRPGGSHRRCINLIFFRRCFNLCGIICAAIAGVPITACGVVCGRVSIYLAGSCASICGYAAYGLCNEGCLIAAGH